MHIHTDDKTQEAYLKQVRQDYVQYFMNIKEVDFSNGERTVLHPSEIKEGDHIIGQGFTIKVTEIKVFQPRPESKTQLPVYQIIGTYVSGELSYYKFMCKQTACGCTYTHFAVIQGNENARWTRIDNM